MGLAFKVIGGLIALLGIVTIAAAEPGTEVAGAAGIILGCGLAITGVIMDQMEKLNQSVSKLTWLYVLNNQAKEFPELEAEALKRIGPMVKYMKKSDDQDKDQVNGIEMINPAVPDDKFAKIRKRYQ